MPNLKFYFFLKFEATTILTQGAEGTYETLQNEIYHGVVDICERNHANGFERMSATITQAVQVAVSSNPLASSTKTQDRQGICHQLANDDRLTWVPGYE